MCCRCRQAAGGLPTSSGTLSVAADLLGVSMDPPGAETSAVTGASTALSVFDASSFKKSATAAVRPGGLLRAE